MNLLNQIDFKIESKHLTIYVHSINFIYIYLLQVCNRIYSS